MSKLSIREKAKLYKAQKEEAIQRLNLKDGYNYHIGSKKHPNVFYIISKSLYKDNHIQVTTFINNLPYSHKTLKSINDCFHPIEKPFMTLTDLYVIEEEANND